jgi:hypothetical protein
MCARYLRRLRAVSEHPDSIDVLVPVERDRQGERSSNAHTHLKFFGLVLDLARECPCIAHRPNLEKGVDHVLTIWLFPLRERPANSRSTQPGYSQAIHDRYTDRGVPDCARRCSQHPTGLVRLADQLERQGHGPYRRASKASARLMRREPHSSVDAVDRIARGQIAIDGRVQARSGRLLTAGARVVRYPAVSTALASSQVRGETPIFCVNSLDSAEAFAYPSAPAISLTDVPLRSSACAMVRRQVAR